MKGPSIRSVGSHLWTVKDSAINQEGALRVPQPSGLGVSITLTSGCDSLDPRSTLEANLGRERDWQEMAW